MNIHKNARLSPKGRELLIARLERGEHPRDVAAAMGVSVRRSINGASVIARKARPDWPIVLHALAIARHELRQETKHGLLSCASTDEHLTKSAKRQVCPGPRSGVY